MQAREEILMTESERREASRMRSERWRRAHGIMPRRPAQQPWLAMGRVGMWRGGIRPSMSVSAPFV